MSAPIDDLLFGGDDDSGDDDLAGPSSFSAPLPASAAIPLTASSIGAVSMPASLASPTASTLRPIPAPALTSPVRMPANPSTTPPAQAVPQLAPPPTTTTSAARQPGSRMQMFQQMFALLQRMLPPEQYRALYAEMRNHNGNDPKSIFDVVKRIAGDAVFATVIQKMNLARKNPTATPAAPTSAPGVAAPTPAVAANRLPVKLEPRAISAPTNVTNGPRPTPVPAPPVVKPEANTATATAAPGSVATPPAHRSDNTKIEFAKQLLQHASVCTAAPGTCNVKKCWEVKRVFQHSLTCGGARGCIQCKQLKALVEYHARECPTKLNEHCTIPFCDLIRRSAAAARAGANSTASASMSMGLSATANAVASVPAVTPPTKPIASPTPSVVAAAPVTVPPATPAPTAAPIPTPQTAASAPTPASASTPANAPTSAATPAPTAKPASSLPAAKPTVTTTATASDDDEDNTPLSSAVSKTKKHPKSKSPRTSSPGRSSSSNSSKKASSSKTTSAHNNTPSPAAANNNANPARAAAAEYGHLLQLILHVQKCTTSNCAVGADCAEAKTLFHQINSPDAPPRAQTFKKVYAHYKVCLAKKTTQTCPMCKIGLLPLTPTAHPSSPTTATSAATSPPAPTLKRGNSNSGASPRSPAKKPRVSTKAAKAAQAQAEASPTSTSEDQVLAQAAVNDIRKEADVLTHTGIDLATERRIMMDVTRRKNEALPCEKDEWAEKNLFNTEALRSQMQAIAQRNGVTLGEQTCDAMSYALRQYLKQIIEEMTEMSKQRGDVLAQSLEQLQKRDLVQSSRMTPPLELTSSDILTVSCRDSFTRVRQEDLALRTRLLEEAKQEEQAEKERSKKRKKVDRVKMQAQEEKNEAEMDIEELAIKDLKEHLLQADRKSDVRVEGRVLESISTKPIRHMVDNEITVEDAELWLQHQKPYIDPKLFVRMEAARILTGHI